MSEREYETVEIGGVRVAYGRRRGDGHSVVLLHGGFSDGRVFDGVVEALATSGETAALDLWAYDRRGHGATPDTDAPFGFDEMAAECIEFLEGVAGGPAHLVGHSDGANVALLVAIRRPDLVRSVTAFSANLDPAGYEEGEVTVDEMVEHVGPVYAAVSPHPERVRDVAAKTIALWSSEPRIDPADLGSIACPVLIADAADDVIRREHTDLIAVSIEGAARATIPDATHMAIEEFPAACADLVRATITRVR